MINSRRKGAKAERKVAALFTKWTGHPFARTPSSGGLNWKASNTKGDIVMTEEGFWFPFCIEVKFHAEINFQHLLYLKGCEIEKFWDQCNRDATKAGKAPLLLMRYNGLPNNFWFIMMKKEHLEIMQNSVPAIDEIMWSNRLIKGTLVIMTSKDFFGFPYKIIRKPLKTYLKNK